MKKILFIKTVMLVACLSARASGPSVTITTTFARSGDTAVTCKTAPTGSFTATPEFEPDDKVEIIIDGPQFQWTIAPSENVSFSPTDAAKVNVGLADNAFGKNYDVSVSVTWIVWDKVIPDFRLITATGSMTLAAIKVIMVGATSNETWPCTCPASTVIFAVNVLPSPPVVDLLWTASCNVGGEINIIPLPCMKSPPLGTPPALASANFFTVFKPSNVPTVSYRITAGLNMIPSCSVGTDLLVRSVPTGKKSSVSEWLSILPETPYGRVYKHTFSSSAGSLNGVKISEDITWVTDPFKFCASNFTYGESIWSLDSNGKMEEWDMRQDPYGGGRININCFHPSPPGAGTPADYSVKQTFGWQCPLCEKYHDFFTHYFHTGLSKFVDVTTIPKYYTTITGDFLYEEEYIGTPYLNFGNFVVAPATTIIANGKNTFQIGWSGSWIKSDNPLAKDLTWNWDTSDTKGCKFDSLTSNPVTVTVGEETGTLTLWLDIHPVGDKDLVFGLHSVSVQLVAP